MANCRYCKRRRARRPCPALEGQICSWCCAKQKMVKIDCPEDCPHLGPAVGRKTAFQRVMDKLLPFSTQEDWGREGVTRFLGPEKEIREWEHECFVAFLCYGHENRAGERLVDIFEQKQGSSLGPNEARVLAALKQARFSLWEAQEVRVDEGIELVDLVTGWRVFVREKSATQTMDRLDTILGWIIPMDDHHELTSIYGVPRPHAEAVLEAIEKVLRREQKAHPEVPAEVALRKAAAPAQRALRKAIDGWRPPRMVTMDNEEIVFCEAIFDLHDVRAVEQRLRDQPDIDDEGGGGFNWQDRRGREQMGPGPLLLGSIRIEKGRLRLEVHSKERLEKGKAFLTGLLGDLGHHRLDGIKDLDVAMSETAAVGPPPPSELPEEVQAEVLSRFMQDRLLQWIDEKIPALKGKTPRQAVKTKAGREKVIAMLKDQEHLARRMPGGDRIDAVAYRELGLDRP